MRRNPGEPQRQSEANRQRTLKRIEKYYMLASILSAYEKLSPDVQKREEAYLAGLRKRVRDNRNYLMNRNDATIGII